VSAHKLLLADDSITIQKVVQLTFIDEGIDVTSTGDGDAAFLRFVEENPDIVLADVHMPGLNGYELCRRIKQSERSVPVVLLVGTFEPFDSDMAHEAGADAFLTKPFQSIRQLVDVVSNLLKNGPGVETAAATPAAEQDESFIETREIPREETAQLGDSGMDDEMIETTPAASLLAYDPAANTPESVPVSTPAQDLPGSFAAPVEEEEYRPDLAETKELIPPFQAEQAAEPEPEPEPVPETLPEPEYEVVEEPAADAVETEGAYAAFSEAPAADIRDESAERYSGFEIARENLYQAPPATIPESSSYETRPRFELVPEPPAPPSSMMEPSVDDSNLLEIPGPFSSGRSVEPAVAEPAAAVSSNEVSPEFVEAVTQRVMEKTNDDFFKNLVREMVPQVVREFAEEKVTE
jgi:CheY-like chemotaxis protein